jgi:hypothetical protein
MELFPATNLQQFEFIKRIIDRCDYYVVIVAARYGSLDGDKSFTEKEYEYALSKNIPVLAFIHKEPGKIAAEKTETDQKQVARLDDFRRRLKASRIVDFWTDLNDLCTNVLVAVTSAVTLSPGIGWVRGDNAIDPKVLQEAGRLRIENEELRKRLAEFQVQELTFDPTILGPDDEFPLSVQLRDETFDPHMTISQIFVGIYDHLLSGPQEINLGYYMGVVAAVFAGKTEPNVGVHMESQEIARLRNQLEALGLIETQSALLGPGGSHIIWSVTPKGKRYAMDYNVLRRKPVAD